MRAAADAPAAPVSAPRARARGFTLIEVLLAFALLLVGGVSILAVFTLAVAHRVERDVEVRVDLLRPEAASLAQGAVDRAKAGEAPLPIAAQPTTHPGFYVDITFARSPNGEPAWVAQITITYRQEGPDSPVARAWRLPPVWLSRATVDLN
jgi:type II secretory pathway pseudopilin PulG